MVLPDGSRCDCVTDTHAVSLTLAEPEFCTSWRLPYARRRTLTLKNQMRHPTERDTSGRGYSVLCLALNNVGAVSAARRAWEPQACPPCWVVAESEAQRVKSDEKKIDYHPI